MSDPIESFVEGLGPIPLPSISIPAIEVRLQIAPDSPKQRFVRVGEGVLITKPDSPFMGMTGVLEAIDKPVPPRKGQQNHSDIEPATWLLVRIDGEKETGSVWFSDQEVVSVH